MSKLSPSDAYAKWAKRLNAAGQDIQTGVQAVTTAPGVKAAAKSDKMLANLTNSVQSGKWGRRVSSVSLTDWQTAMTQKGIPRISAGVAGAQAKSTDFFTQFLPFMDNVVQSIQNMPDTTVEDGIARSAAVIRGAAKFVRK